ncbi:glycosyltransferase family 2 protein [Saccharopolyspora sp. K220]|nr:glycosyltransferase family 2 protein [Saccharopolyspora soli]
MPLGFRPLVVDNGSEDGSADVAQSHGAVVVREPRRGYGAAVHAGLTAATAEFVCFLDCDGSMDPGVLPALVALVRQGKVDLAVGRRVPVSAAAWPWHARAGNALIAGLLRRRGLPVHDIAPIRAARRVDLLRLEIADRAFGYPLELLCKAAEANWRVHELDIAYRPRASGTRSKVSGSVRGTVRAVRDMAGVLW